MRNSKPLFIIENEMCAKSVSSNNSIYGKVYKSEIIDNLLEKQLQKMPQCIKVNFW